MQSAAAFLPRVQTGWRYFGQVCLRLVDALALGLAFGFDLGLALARLFADAAGSSSPGRIAGAGELSRTMNLPTLEKSWAKGLRCPPSPP